MKLEEGKNRVFLQLTIGWERLGSKGIQLRRGSAGSRTWVAGRNWRQANRTMTTKARVCIARRGCGGGSMSARSIMAGEGAGLAEAEVRRKRPEPDTFVLSMGSVAAGASPLWASRWRRRRRRGRRGAECEVNGSLPCSRRKVHNAYYPSTESREDRVHDFFSTYSVRMTEPVWVPQRLIYMYHWESCNLL